MISRQGGTWVWDLTRAEPGTQRRLLRRAGLVLSRGGAVAFPTETVYGLGACGLDPAAVRRIFRIKGRPQDNPLILHVARRYHAQSLARVDQRSWELMGLFWPGPLTLVLPAHRQVPAEVRAGLPTVALRCPDHPLALELLEITGLPVAAPSANRSGRPSPTTCGHVLQDLRGRVGLILDGGPTGIGVESTVLDVSGPIPTILRPGGLSREALEAVLGRVELAVGLSGRVPPSPGMKYRHYAPRAQVYLVRGRAPLRGRAMAQLAQKLEARGLKIGFMATDETSEHLGTGPLISMGSLGDPTASALALYQGLRTLDLMGLDVILAEEIGSSGLGLAVTDRLRRAAVRIFEAGEVTAMGDNRERSILLVCSGNTCRSPMAAAILKSLDPQGSVESAGIAAREGDRAAEMAQRAMSRRGISLETHRARKVTGDMLRKADLVLVMSPHHRESLAERYPELAAKIRLLAAEAGEGDTGIPDPYGGGLEIYEETADRLEAYLRAFLKRQRPCRKDPGAQEAQGGEGGDVSAGGAGL